MNYLNKVGEKAFGCVLDLGIRHVANIFSYGKNVDELNNSIKDLGLAKERVDHLRDEAEKNLHNIEGQVAEWFRKVEECETEVEEFRNDEGHRKTRLLHYLFPYLWNRYRLGKQAVEMIEDVKNLIDECSKFKEVAYRENITSNDVTLSNAGYVEFASRKSIMENVMAQLEDSTVRMIGLHGPGGVGKSTLIKDIAKKSQNKKLFDVVVKVEITANPNPQKIQEEIAYVLGLRLEGEGENVRADCLRRRLKQEKESILVILDDLWDRLDLNKLGIPLDGDVDDKQDPKDGNKEKFVSDCKGCKILLTSRDKNVLTDKMEVKSTFFVEKLDDEDALRLFQKEARIHGELSKWKQEIVKKHCAGLPMAIVTVGRALRDKSDSEWEKLKNQVPVGVQSSMEISIKMSYDHLENEELKSIFFLCAQMGHQPLIMDLVKYCFGLGILKGVYSLGEARGRISTSIQKLKDSGLVLDGSSSIHFNMHDLVQDAALSIAHKEQNVFTLKNGKLDDWPELERCTSISICNSHIINELPSVLNCPQLKFFQIDNDDPSLKIPESFFKRMKKLRVLMLTGIQLSSLPSSIESLSDLKLLCLERCTLNHNLSIIGKLKKLRILSFSGSRIENFPAELKDLDKLQLLDISNCSIVKRIPPNLMSRLTSLEELYVRESFIEVSVEGERNQSQISFLSELKHLHQLQVVDLSIPCAEVFPKELFFDNLNDYKIVIGNFKTLSVGDFRMPNKYEKFKSLALEMKDDIDNIHSQIGIKLLFKRVENLLLGELNGVQDVINELNLDGFPDLKHLSITNNNGIKYINSMDLSHSQDVFPNLEFLCLYKLTNIEMICPSPVTIASFAKLKTIKVNGCTRLKSLFSFYRDKFFASLETIDVSECDSLEEIVEILVNPDKVEFLKLHSLTLQSLSSFTCFYTTVEGRSIPQLTKRSDRNPPLFGELVEIPNLESLNLSSIRIDKIWSDQLLPSFCFQNLVKLVVKGCNNLRYLCSLSVASGLKKLKALFVSECQLMEKIFGTVGNSANKVCVFLKLEEIYLDHMNLLTDIWHAEVSVDSFSSLTYVYINCCHKLDKIFPSHMEGWFASLNSLNVYDCMSVDVIFEIKDSQQVDASGGIDTNLQVVDVCELPNLKQVWSRDPIGILNFKKLQSIQISGCQRLRNVFRASVVKDVPQLEYMSVKYCDKIVEIVACEDGSKTNTEQLVFPELTYMDLCYLPSIQHFYRGRHPIECPKLKTLIVDRCNKELKTFPTRETTNKEDEAVFSAEKIFPNLEYLEIDFNKAKNWLLSNIVKHRMHRLKELTLSRFNDGEHLCQILYRMPNLEKLNLWFSEIKDLLLESSKSRLGTVLLLKKLFLSWSSIEDIGFEREPILQRVKLLGIQRCHKLRNLGPPSVSLAYLTDLEVGNCSRLRNLMASSTAKSLVQLKSMKIMACDELEEIVTNEGNEEEKQIVFDKLITIKLKWLQRLESFCSYKYCEFKFPSLEILIVEECPMMQTFTEGGAKVPKLQNTVVAFEGKEETKCRWEVDLNAFIQRHFNKILESVSSLSLRGGPVIQGIWLGSRPIPNGCFSNLNSLTVERCQFLSDAVLPFYLLPLFTNLEQLEVSDCDSVKSIFDVKCITQERERKLLRFALKKLTLKNLPKLENVWNEDPHGILSMQLLQQVYIKNCDYLTSAFPASVAKDLVKLEYLDVINCDELVEIVAEENADPRGANLELTFPYFYYCSKISGCDSIEEVVSKEGDESDENGIIFKQLNCLELRELPKLRSFYRGSLLSLPSLLVLSVIKCDWMEILFPGILKADKDKLLEVQLYESSDTIKLENDLNSTMRKAFGEKILESESYLSLGDGDGDGQVIQEIWLGSRSIPNGCFSNLFSLTLDECQFLSDAVLPFFLLPLLTQLQKLKVQSCHSVKSIFDVKCITQERERKPLTFALKELTLIDLPKLENVWNEDPHGILSMQFLQVSVDNCECLTSMFPASVAKDLVKPEDLVVENCEELKEIVAEDTADPRGANLELTFPCLNVRSLKLLRLLETYTVSFSNLTYLEVTLCHGLRYLFTSSTAKSLGQLKTMKIDRCDSIEEVVCKEADESHENGLMFKQLNCLELTNLTELRSFYRGSLLSLPSLEVLSVIGCHWMETLCPGTLKADKLLRVKLEPWLYPIKLENDLNSTMRKAFGEMLLKSAYSVSYIDLKNSPLQQIWLRLDSLHIPDLCFSHLRTLIVDGCHFLSDAVLPFYLLPLLPHLETLEVRNCDFVKIIFDVTTVGLLPFALKKLILERLPNLENVWNAYPKETNLELTFPQVKSLALCDLPKLKYDMLKPFTNLEHLTLGEHELKMILRGEFQGNHLNNLKVVLAQSIAYDVFLQRVPNIEKLEVCDGSFKEIFCFDSLDMDEAGLLSQLKVLCSDSLPELVSIGSENSRIVPFLRNLETLEVISCFSSIYLVPCTVSFSNLTYLQVKSCNSLLYLFTSSTAKSLGQLKTMKIKSCDSVEEIVSKEEDESHENEIIFEQLNCLKLEGLRKLRRFYKGSLSFPSLKELSVIHCDGMETFCAGTVKTDKLLEVKFERYGGFIPLETDLNSAMQNREAFLATATTPVC